MSLTIDGYNLIETLYEGSTTRVYRALRELDRASVIIKTIKAEYPSIEQIARLRHEYKILQSLDIEGIVKPLALESYRNGIALILSDFDGETLKKLINSQRFEVSRFLPIAIQLSSILTQLHQNNIIHKDIKPHNIIINPQTSQVKIIDFSISSCLLTENTTINNPNLLEGTLAYMSPEQTGRMNRSIDYRTDFYSLGITFYEMLTGQLPFQATDFLELVHCHIAKQPIPPCDLAGSEEQEKTGELSIQNPDIPQAVSNIVMKLLAKTAEERYQSALGLKTDLEACLKMLEESGKISLFNVGQLDLYSQFLIPQKLYGREREVAILIDAFDRVSLGATEMMLVSGYSGIGKSSLVHEVHKPIVRQRGYFISGKFDQFKRNIPYASLIQAFQELMRQLLTESPEKIGNWKVKLLEALGQQGRVIIDVIPEVERIVGPQPIVPQLGSVESQNRFNRVFQQFIRVFTQPEHPLVLFLDDLQWADSASLRLIQLLACDPDSHYLLLIGAYRDNEVSPTHPLMLTLEEMHSCGAIANNIVLQPLHITHVSALVSDTLRCNTEKSKPLAELVFNKTQGNPFFLTQLLKSLYQENLLFFDFAQGCWQWDVARLQSIDITENVVELMVSQIHRLSQKTQNALKLAACIGDKFTLDVLAIVNEKSQSETAQDLWEALQADLVVPLNGSYKIPLVLDQEVIISGQDFVESPIPTHQDAFNGATSSLSQITYKFLHDRVQQAAYFLIPNNRKKETHLKIGQLLLQNTALEEREETIFDLVNQLNYGTDLLNSEVEKYELAQLNLIAGRKAKAAMAYEAAVNYLSMGIKLLPELSWIEQYDLTLNLYVEVTEAEYLCTKFDRATAYAEIVLQQAKSLLDRVKIMQIKMQMYMSQVMMQEARDTGLQVLEMLGVRLEEAPPNLPRIEELLDLPEMTDPDKLAATQILITLVSAVFFTDPSLYPKIVFTLIHLSAKYGNAPPSMVAYGFYGMLLCGSLTDIDSGYRYGQLALNLLDKLNATEFKCKLLNIFYAGIAQWKKPLRATLEHLQYGLKVGLETGELEYGSYCAYNYCTHYFFTGEPLELINNRWEQYVDLMQTIKQEWAVNSINLLRQTILNLQGHVENKYLLIGNIVNEDEIIPIFKTTNNFIGLALIYLVKTIIFYIFKRPKDAVESAILSDKYVGTVTGLISCSEQNFYYSLALLAQYPYAEKSEQQPYLIQVSSNQEKMKVWADSAPENFKHKYELVEAERARVLGQYWQAMEYYDRAIAGAKEQGFIQEEAIAAELAAELCFSRGKENIARDYLIQSYYAYAQWGATAKIKDLEASYPHILFQITEHKSSSIETHRTRSSTSIGTPGALDLAAVIKASQALSGEIVMGNLLNKLMHILLENAGAQTVFLILEKEGNLLIEAAGSVSNKEIAVQQAIPVEDSPYLPLSVINYVRQTQESVVLNDANHEGGFTTDAYIINQKPKSVLCTPIVHQGKLIGILYLENNLTKSAFTSERLEVLQLLSSQAAISLENARLYNDLEGYNRTLETKVEERTLELQEKNLQLQIEIQVSEAAVRERKRAEEAAEAANRAKSEFLANMSHELRTPLNGILGYTQIFKKDKTLTEQHKNGIGIIHQCGEHLLTLINDILDLSKIEARKMELDPKNFHFPQFLECIVEICRIRAEQKGLELIYKTRSPLPQFIRTDDKRLRQVLINLLGNAVKFTEKGTITFKVGYQGRKLRFQVEDTGIGIAPHHLEEIFMPFQQVGNKSRETEGTGLGLAISRQLVQMMGSELKVKSTLGKGSVFWLDLDLPEIDQGADIAKVEERNIIGFVGCKRKVLVVDDNWANRSVLLNLLEPLGFDVLEAQDGLDGLNKAREFKPDLIFMDLVMSVLDGFEATRRLRMLPDLEGVIVIAISASVFDFDRQQSRDVGCDDFLPKPIREADLLEKLRLYLGLEWVYEESGVTGQESGVTGQGLGVMGKEQPINDNTPLTNPESVVLPAEELAILLDLAMRGDLRGIVEQTTRIEVLDQQWIPLATHLRQLAKEFKGKQILELLKNIKRQNEC